MISLAQKWLNDGRQEGRQEGQALLIRRMFERLKNTQAIADAVGLELTEIEKILKTPSESEATQK